MDPAPASDLGRVGLVVGGKFRLEQVIGRGGMGAVWSATHVGLGHRVALKLVAREFVRSPEALRRFDAEAKAAARLQSRHVVQVFDNGTLEDGTPYIAMELLSGESLEQRIARTGPLVLAEAARVLAQCGKALARAHAAGIVHRDIKPDNIFLAKTPDEEADVVKILDFGVAKVTLEGWTSQTGTGAMLGTPLYMSPEQVRGLRDIDHRTDLYSLGLVAFVTLTGQLAISGEVFGELLLKICTQPLPSLRALAPYLPPTMEGWFQRACAREAAERFQSAQEFVDALRLAAGESASFEGRVTPFPGLPALPPTMHSSGPPMASGVGPGAHGYGPMVSGIAPGPPGYGPMGSGIAPAAPAYGPMASGIGPAVGAPVGGPMDSSLGLSAASSLVMTAAGVPRRPVGALVAGGLLAALLALGVTALVLLAPHHPDAPPAAATALPSSADPAAGAAAPSAVPSETAPTTSATRASLPPLPPAERHDAIVATPRSEPSAARPSASSSLVHVQPAAAATLLSPGSPAPRPTSQPTATPKINLGY